MNAHKKKEIYLTSSPLQSKIPFSLITIFFTFPRILSSCFNFFTFFLFHFLDGCGLPSTFPKSENKLSTEIPSPISPSSPLYIHPTIHLQFPPLRVRTRVRTNGYLQLYKPILISKIGSHGAGSRFRNCALAVIRGAKKWYAELRDKMGLWVCSTCGSCWAHNSH